ncbi:hypothetical protein OEA41_002364 [Lepraria neglecta]|uniref:F-box domain-containing protein n=1 Tax=Lepraria neglecta TaxID=209136 RepID=A0AAD9ZCB3_9LECA|nr:hypothetical protein OEA41_002364 [Lepraria neglecta]
MDNTEILYYCGKLVEFLPNAEADCLVDLLAVPVKPSPMQVSSATKLVYDISEIEPLPTEANLKPTCKIQSYLTSVPDELLLMIFHNLDFVSCFRLSLVSKRLWNIGWPFVQQDVTNFMGTWAGTRIICLGDYCEPGDLPAGFLTTEEENIVNEGLDEAEMDPDEGFLPRPGNLLDVARCRFQEVSSEVEPYRMLLDTALDEAGHLPESERSQARLFAVGKKVTDYYPETESWILRNLTTAEFVQGDRLLAAFHRSGREGGPHLGYPGFGEAIMCRICWSTSDTTLPCAGFNRGVWAGHRFEICTEKYHALHSSCSWKDATSEIIDELSVALDLPTLTKESKKIGPETST